QDVVAAAPLEPVVARAAVQPGADGNAARHLDVIVPGLAEDDDPPGTSEGLGDPVDGNLQLAGAARVDDDVVVPGGAADDEHPAAVHQIVLQGRALGQGNGDRLVIHAYPAVLVGDGQRDHVRAGFRRHELEVWRGGADAGQVERSAIPGHAPG